MLDLGRLRVLRELKMRGTLGAVADALGYTPSAVSQQLAQLQRDVGVPVVERAGRRLRLTEAGEVLAEHAEVLLARAKRAEEDALAASGRVAGVVRLVGFQTALLHVLAPALPRLAAKYPDLVVDVLDEEFHRVLQALVLQEIDVVLTDEYSHLPRPRRPELRSEVLITEMMRVALPEDHPLARDAGAVRMADLAGSPWVTGHVGTNHADLLERTCVELGGFRPEVRYRSNDLLIIFAMVAQGGAVCLVPDLVLAEREEGIVVRDIADAPVDRRMVLWTRVGAEVRPSVEAVLRELRHSADLLVERRPSCVRGAP
ncbi:DNA-binding transcriptional regulator, LysR family [Actinomadura madurae]|uniref:DNA-binding transcriptional regulator, LysR family n=1 Tax=Actinomadura madurae TaxID=1993 RepID=A0A1I5C8T5_9ACTN|nr:LysR family transcriptional regulator [Actinomadura madurae]SFN83061.1 DNA-binding transcriptional regulator, LysR family [Actinomadura madurae]